MVTSVYTRITVSGGSPADGTSTPAFNRDLIVFDGPLDNTLVRSRVSLSLRVRTYSTGTDPRPLDVDWWVDTFPAYGLFWTDAAEAVPLAPDPMNADFSEDWVMIDDLVGDVEFIGTDVNGNETLTYRWIQQAGIQQSFGRRKPTVGYPGRLFLAWQFNDPGFLINQSHLSFPQAYDLAATWNVWTWWKPPVT